MNHGIDSIESTDIRRALDRLQAALEDLGDRLREVRRDRRQMHEYILELEREVDRAERAVSEQTEAEAAERARSSDLLERIQQAERRHGELMGRIGELEQAVSERESLIAEQEDLLQQYQGRFDEARELGARNETARKELDSEVARLREELELVRASEQDALRRVRELESSAGGGESAEEIASLTAQLLQMRQAVEQIESERGELVANQARLADELQAVRRGEAEARDRAVALESAAAEAAERERVRGAIAVELEQRNRALELEVEALTARLRDAEAGEAEVERARLLEVELERSRAALADREEAVSSTSRQVDTLRQQLTLFEQQVGQLQAERDRLALSGEANGTGVRLDEQERKEMIGQIESAIGVIDRYLGQS